MALVCDVAATVFLALGSFVGFTGALGILRMPDFYTRLHPSGKNDTLAQMLIMVGLLFQVYRTEYASITGIAPRLVMITLFIFLTSPISTHAITRAAHLDGLKIWEREESKGA